MAAPVSKGAAPAPTPVRGGKAQMGSGLGGVVDRLVGEMCQSLSLKAEPFERVAAECLSSILPDFIAAWSPTGFLDLPRAPQHRAENNYGSPTVTLFRDHRFRVEVIFWGAGPEVYVHDHVEPGAFGVVRGARLHATYCFAPLALADADIEIGQLQPRGMELLRPGAVVEIPPGDGLVHSLFYPGPANITLSVRKTAEVWREGGLSRFYIAPSIRLAMSGDAGADRFSDFLRREMESGEAVDPGSLLRAYCQGDKGRILRLLLTDWVNASPEIFRCLVDMVQVTFGDYSPRVIEAVEHFRRAFLYRATHDRLTTAQSAIAFLLFADLRASDAPAIIQGLRSDAGLDLDCSVLDDLGDLAMTLDGHRVMILDAGQVAGARDWFTEAAP